MVTLEDIEFVKESYLDAMETLKTKKKLDCVMLLVTNVIKSESFLLLTPHREIEEKLIYNKISDNLYDLPAFFPEKSSCCLKYSGFWKS